MVLWCLFGQAQRHIARIIGEKVQSIFMSISWQWPCSGKKSLSRPNSICPSWLTRVFANLLIFTGAAPSPDVRPGDSKPLGQLLCRVWLDPCLDFVEGDRAVEHDPVLSLTAMHEAISLSGHLQPHLFLTIHLLSSRAPCR
jgi:hypothetical protein